VAASRAARPGAVLTGRTVQLLRSVITRATLGLGTIVVRERRYPGRLLLPTSLWMSEFPGRLLLPTSLWMSEFPGRLLLPTSLWMSEFPWLSGIRRGSWLSGILAVWNPPWIMAVWNPVDHGCLESSDQALRGEFSYLPQRCCSGSADFTSISLRTHSGSAMRGLSLIASRAARFYGATQPPRCRGCAQSLWELPPRWFAIIIQRHD
jgi:hypothetical protein